MLSGGFSRSRLLSLSGPALRTDVVQIDMVTVDLELCLVLPIMLSMTVVLA
jgi:hypothetical protein